MNIRQKWNNYYLNKCLQRLDNLSKEKIFIAEKNEAKTTTYKIACESSNKKKLIMWFPNAFTIVNLVKIKQKQHTRKKLLVKVIIGKMLLFVMWFPIYIYV